MTITKLNAILVDHGLYTVILTDDCIALTDVHGDVYDVVFVCDGKFDDGETSMSLKDWLEYKSIHKTDLL